MVIQLILGVRFKSAHESFSENYGGSDNTKFDANTISFNKSYNGHLGINDTNDWYKFTVPSYGNYEISWVAPTNKGVHLYNESNEYLWCEVKENYRVTWTLNQGTYYLRFTSEDSWSRPGAFSFQISKPEVPKATSISKLQSNSKGFKVNVKKVSAEGYQYSILPIVNLQRQVQKHFIKPLYL